MRCRFALAVGFTASVLVLARLDCPLYADRTSAALLPVTTVLQAESASKQLWRGLTIFAVTSDYFVPRGPELRQRFEQRLAKKPQVGGTAQRSLEEEWNYTAKHREKLLELFDELPLTNCENTLFCRPGMLPLRFARGSGGVALLVTGVDYDSVFNTQRTTERERAARVVSSVILPQLSCFDSIFGGTDVKYYGMLVYYSSRDFAAGDPSWSDSTRDFLSLTSTQAELVALVVAAADAKKYASALMTEEQLLARSETYLSDRNMEKGVKRVKLAL